VDGTELDGYEVVSGMLIDELEELETTDEVIGVELITGTLLLEKGTLEED